MAIEENPSTEEKKPQESGSNATQQPGEKTLEGEVLLPPAGAADFSHALAGLMERNSRILGGIGQTELIHSIVHRLEVENHVLRARNESLQNEKAGLREALATANADLKNERASKRLKTLCASIGVFLITQVMDIYKGSSGLGISIGFIGLALIGVGFFDLSRRAKTDGK